MDYSYSTYTYSLVVKVFQVMLQRKVQNGIERNEEIRDGIEVYRGFCLAFQTAQDVAVTT